MSAVYAAALAAHEAGLCVLPPKEDGTKAPDASSWTRYQTTRPIPAELDAWYASGRRSGIGYVTGAVSGNLELFDFDTVETYEAFVALARAAGLGELVERIEAGYLEASPACLLEGGLMGLLSCNSFLSYRRTVQREPS